MVDKSDIPSTIPSSVEVFERGEEWWGRDDHGEFKLDSGSRVPVSKEDVGYEPCNAVLKFTWDRYGETRYCTGMAAGNFGEDVREHPEFCKHHQVRAALRQQAMDRLTTGAFTQSYKHMFQKLQPHERVVAVRMFDELLDESVHDFEQEDVDTEIDMSEADWWEDDSATLTYPVPHENLQRAKALWFSVLDFLRMEHIQEELFAAAQDDEDLAVGEKRFVVATTTKEVDGQMVTEPIWAKDEHHFNLTISRIARDYQEHLAYGGVSVDHDEGGESISRESDWVLFELPGDGEPEPEQQIEGAPTPFDLQE